MKVRSRIRAAGRIRSATLTAVAGGVLVPVGCWVAAAAPRQGLLTAFFGLVVLHAALRQRQDLRLLDALSGRTVGDIAERVPVLRNYGSADGIAELRHMAGRHVAAVPTDDGWRLLTYGDVADAVLAAPDGRFSGDWTRYLRAVPILEPDVPADCLCRLPQRSERWLVVGSGDAPRIITAGTLLRTARDRAPAPAPEEHAGTPPTGAPLGTDARLRV